MNCFNTSLLRNWRLTVPHESTEDREFYKYLEEFETVCESGNTIGKRRNVDDRQCAPVFLHI